MKLIIVGPGESLEFVHFENQLSSGRQTRPLVARSDCTPRRKCEAEKRDPVCVCLPVSRALLTNWPGSLYLPTLAGCLAAWLPDWPPGLLVDQVDAKIHQI